MSAAVEALEEAGGGSVIELHALGDALIKVGDREVRPSSPLVFATLLYLCVERGRRVPRRELQELLFPDASESVAAHSLRQVLYKIRKLGAPLDSDNLAVWLPTGSVLDAHESMLAGSSPAHGYHGLNDFLPDFTPRLSRRFAIWIDEQRALFCTNARERLLLLLDQAAARADLRSRESLSRHLLMLDPLNEAGIVALTESLVLTGRRQEALRTLNAYAAEVDGDQETVGRVRAFRRRILELADRNGEGTLLLGRDEDLRWLLALHSPHRATSSRTVLIWGAPGIGKSRLMSEYANRLHLQRVHVHLSSCREFEQERPFGPFVGLLPRLLDSRGAFGASPLALQTLRQFAGQPAGPLDNDVSVDSLKDAFVELVVSIAAEQALTLIIDDVQWLDKDSWRLILSEDLLEARCNLTIVMARRPIHASSSTTRSLHRVLTRRLEGLDAISSMALLKSIHHGAASLSDDIIGQYTAICGGNPLLLTMLARHLALGGSSPRSLQALTEILRERLHVLSPTALLLARAAAIAGHWSSAERLAQLVGLPHADMLLAVQELSDIGVLVRHSSAVRCVHSLVEEIIIADTPEPLRQALWFAASRLLEAEAERTRSPMAFWGAAEYWQKQDKVRDASRCLQRSAEMAVASGQVALGIAAWEKAAGIAQDDTSQVALMNALTLADEWRDTEAVMRLAPQILADRVSSAHSHAAHVALLTARRQQGDVLWNDAAQLSAMALDRTVDQALRERAVRMFYLSAEQALAGEAATTLRDELITARVFATDGPSWPALESIYHMAFGDLAEAVELGAAALARSDQRKSTDRVRRMLSLAVAMFRYGEITLCLDLFGEALQHCRDLQAVRSLLAGSATLTAVHFALGNFDGFREQHRITQHLVNKHKSRAPAAHLANDVEYALLLGDPTAAEYALDTLKQIAESATPYHARTVIAYSVCVGRLQSKRLEESTWQQMGSLYDKGKTFCDHDSLVRALSEELLARGQRQSAHALAASYCKLWRRERYPVPEYLNRLLSAPEDRTTWQPELARSVTPV